MDVLNCQRVSFNLLNDLSQLSEMFNEHNLNNKSKGGGDYFIAIPDNTFKKLFKPSYMFMLARLDSNNMHFKTPSCSCCPLTIDFVHLFFSQIFRHRNTAPRYQEGTQN